MRAAAAILSLILSGCAGSPVQPSTVMASVPVVSVAPAAAPTLALEAAALVNCDYERVVVGFDLGVATVINHSSCANDFTLAAFRMVDLVLANQIYLGQASARLEPGESRQIVVKLPPACGLKVQQDVWVGISPSVRVSVSTGERWWSVERTPTCEAEPPVVTTSPTPPPVMPPVVLPPVLPPVVPPVVPPVEPPVDMCIKDPLWCQPMPPPEPPTQDKPKCNQGRGNGPEGCDPGDSNHHNPSNDEGEDNRGKGKGQP